jgi:predicted aspartyl protease
LGIEFSDSSKIFNENFRQMLALLFFIKVFHIVAFAVGSVLFYTSASIESVIYHKIVSQGKIQNADFTSSVPFDYKMNGIIVLKVKINGSDEEYEFIYDTGASVSMISREMADALDIKRSTRSTTIDSQKNKKKNDFVVLNDVTIGNVTFSEIAAGIIDYPKESIFRCIAKDGIIGANIIRKANWQVDFHNNILHISDMDFTNFSEKAVSVPMMKSFSGKPYVSAEVNGVYLQKVLVDLGSNGSLDLPLKYKPFVKHGTAFTSTQYDGTTMGIFGPANEKVLTGSVEKLNFGSIEVEQAQVKFRTKTTLKVGNLIWSKYNITFDNKNNRIILDPQQQKVEQRVTNWSGMLLERISSGEVVVTAIEGRSPAFKTGIMVGDRLFSINGKKVADYPDYCSFEKWKRDELRTSKIEVLLEGSSKKHIIKKPV